MHRDFHAGGDPRNYLEFTEIRNEVNKLSNPAASEVDFELIKTLSSDLFSKNGIDLQTACYATLAETRLAGLTGFSDGCTLIAELIERYWDTLWPENETARIEMLDWLNNRIGLDIRNYKFKAADIPLLLQLEQPLKRIAEVLQSRQLKKETKVIELYKFVINTRETLEKRAVDQLRQDRKQALLPQETTPEPETKPVAEVAEVVAKPEQSQVPVHIHQAPVHQTQPPVSVNLPFSPPPPRVKAWHGFVVGVLLASAAFIGFMYGNQQSPRLMETHLFSPLPQQEIIQYANQLQTEPFYRLQPDLTAYQEQLTILTGQSPLASRYYGDNLSALMVQLWPDSKKATAVKQQWEQFLNTQRNQTPLNDNYAQAQKRIAALIRQLNQAESQRNPLAYSQLKNSLTVIQRQLSEQEPVEEVLRQLVEAEQLAPEKNQLLEQRLNSLLSQYHQLLKEKR
ncbi:type VI secretion system ImpA family N-terminal domain-containing protein [Budviciaceae bacterium CWB-B4]|uniref:Type VI secretion system ImpA family N-terminal domain-containing protein n=1 Tax=Limnobaculum xujianqingii TaxID=2738837 RepID=A0A9D7AGD7_9GAMM|nr:VasL domain-containing protein [Limnobaculum xujianqingii]MBK5072158.1 type VI secretion system ImpA family N-terminal domain-containing protein [Limnobaculum xujianqingii]MBK5175467.1 type VI secretion system ImpA family N-terminal domain-containing protein [Limnobaculum xujianqingii]